jgi:hypothetical protein
MATVRVLMWRDIPTSVKAMDDAGRRVSRAMPDRFGQEVDRVAMREGITGSDEYLAGFAWTDPTEEPGSAEEAADRVVARLAEGWVAVR